MGSTGAGRLSAIGCRRVAVYSVRPASLPAVRSLEPAPDARAASPPPGRCAAGIDLRNNLTS
jgi:hypothetical protein